MMYKKVGTVSHKEMMNYLDVLSRAEWRESVADDRHYLQASVTEPLLGFPDYVGAFFVMLPAEVGMLHRHADNDLQRKVAIESFNVVITNNEDCISGWYETAILGEKLRWTILEQGKVYLTDRTVDHQSWNYGESDRVHLIVEMPLDR